MKYYIIEAIIFIVNIIENILTIIEVDPKNTNTQNTEQHKNTVNYKINKIEEILDLNLSDIGDKSKIYLSLITKISYIDRLFYYTIFLKNNCAYALNVYSYMSAPAFMATDVFGKKESSVILGTISLLFALGFAYFT